MYGRPAAGLTRQALHAWRIGFNHPITGQRHSVVAPLPRDIHDIAGRLAERLPEDGFFGRA
jgi:hypothetical protein